LHYGYAGIFMLLVLGIVGLPIPDETLLTFAGYLIFRKHLSFAPTLLSAFVGSMCGISISYALGKGLGFLLLHKYGKYLHIHPEQLERISAWFARFGKWSLPVGYFVPGVRHLTAYLAGASELPFPVFALFAYTGGLFWSLTFILLGYSLGNQWDTVLNKFEDHFLPALAAIIAVQILLFLFKQRLFRK